MCSDKVLHNSFLLERCESPLCNFQKITITIIIATKQELFTKVEVNSGGCLPSHEVVNIHHFQQHCGE